MNQVSTGLHSGKNVLIKTKDWILWSFGASSGGQKRPSASRAVTRHHHVRQFVETMARRATERLVSIRITPEEIYNPEWTRQCAKSNLLASLPPRVRVKMKCAPCARLAQLLSFFHSPTGFRSSRASIGARDAPCGIG